MKEYELKWIIKDKSGQNDENTERQKDNTHDSEGFHPNFNELIWTNILQTCRALQPSTHLGSPSITA